MYKFKHIVLTAIVILILQACSQVLETVSFVGGNKKPGVNNNQENFDINIKSLTFKSAMIANKAAYPRQLMLPGSGAKAKVSNEAEFLTSNLPKSTNKFKYLLGYGDELSFTLVSEFQEKKVKWPNSPKPTEYLLGVGDQLNFIQIQSNIDTVEILSKSIEESLTLANRDAVSSKGVIGSNGNVLLLGIGNINAAGKTINEIRDDVRNLIISKGQQPNFQLEISSFRSKRVFVSRVDTNKNEIIYLNNLNLTLQEIALRSGISESARVSSVIKLSRNSKTYRLTARQLFNKKSPKIYIQNNDRIEIDIISSNAFQEVATVGSNGKVLLRGIGNINAKNRTLDELRDEISKKLIDNDLKPTYQLEISKFSSKKAYLIQKDGGTKILKLTNVPTSLKDIIIANNGNVSSSKGLTIVTLKRDGKTYRIPTEQILNQDHNSFWIINNDQIELQTIAYKPGQVFALSGSTGAQIIPINPSKRETLADVLFVPGGALGNRFAKRSEVYLLRGGNPAIALHLNAQDVSRILVAAKAELRPNDIIYVAERPIISFSRTLSEILPLRVLLRDIQEGNIP